MRKNVKRALACAAAAVLAGGLTFAAACSGNYYSSAPLDGSYEYDEVVSNGGFAVQAGDWVYFINGVESNTADSNSYGDGNANVLAEVIARHEAISGRIKRRK